MAQELWSLCRMPTRPSRLMGLPLGDARERVQALGYDLGVMRGAQEYRRVKVQEAMAQMSGDEMGIGRVLLVLLADYIEG